MWNNNNLKSAIKYLVAYYYNDSGIFRYAGPCYRKIGPGDLILKPGFKL
jgi:hypothetical protein